MGLGMGVDMGLTTELWTRAAHGHGQDLGFRLMLSMGLGIRLGEAVGIFDVTEVYTPQWRREINGLLDRK